MTFFMARLTNNAEIDCEDWIVSACRTWC